MKRATSSLCAFAGSDFLVSRHPTRLGVTILVSGAIALAIVGAGRLVLQRQLDHLVAVEARAQEHARRRATPPPKADLAADRARASLLDELRSPWDVALRAIEQVSDTGTTLVAADPDFRTKTLRLDVSASAMADIWAYADALRLAGVRTVDVERVTAPKNGGASWDARLVARWGWPDATAGAATQGGSR